MQDSAAHEGWSALGTAPLRLQTNGSLQEGSYWQVPAPLVSGLALQAQHLGGGGWGLTACSRSQQQQDSMGTTHGWFCPFIALLALCIRGAPAVKGSVSCSRNRELFLFWGSLQSKLLLMQPAHRMHDSQRHPDLGASTPALFLAPLKTANYVPFN